MSAPPTPDAEKVAALRELLPATGAGIYLDTATAGPLPAETAAAMREADEWEVRVGRAAAGREDDRAQRAEEARAVLAALVGGDPRQILPTAGLEQALALALWSVPWRPADRLLTTASDAPSIRAPFESLQRSIDLELDVLAADARDGGPGALVEAVAERLTSRTRLVLLSHVTPDDGCLTPISEIARLARADGARVLVDATRSAGAVLVDAQELGADFVAFRADAWLLGPEGSAALWRRAEEEEAASAVRAAGGLSRTALLGLARSVGWLEMYVGLPWAIERGQRLARWLAEELTRLDGVQLLTPIGQMGTIVTFRLSAWKPEDAADELGRRVFSILRPLAGYDGLRCSVAWFNTEDELGRFVNAVAELGRHTPETLPRRPTLSVL